MPAVSLCASGTTVLSKVAKVPQMKSKELGSREEALGSCAFAGLVRPTSHVILHTYPTPEEAAVPNPRAAASCGGAIGMTPRCGRCERAGPAEDVAGFYGHGETRN